MIWSGTKERKWVAMEGGRERDGDEYSHVWEMEEMEGKKKLHIQILISSQKLRESSSSA